MSIVPRETRSCQSLLSSCCVSCVRRGFASGVQRGLAPSCNLRGRGLVTSLIATSLHVERKEKCCHSTALKDILVAWMFLTHRSWATSYKHMAVQCPESHAKDSCFAESSVATPAAPATALQCHGVAGSDCSELAMFIGYGSRFRDPSFSATAMTSGRADELLDVGQLTW